MQRYKIRYILVFSCSDFLQHRECSIAFFFILVSIESVDITLYCGVDLYMYMEEHTRIQKIPKMTVIKTREDSSNAASPCLV